MRKTLFVIIGFCVLLSLITGAFAEEYTNCYSYKLPQGGDANKDGEVNIADPIYLLNSLFGSNTLYPIYSDANGDGLIDISDAVSLLQYLFMGGEKPADIYTLEKDSPLRNAKIVIKGDKEDEVIYCDNVPRESFFIEPVYNEEIPIEATEEQREYFNNLIDSAKIYLKMNLYGKIEDRLVQDVVFKKNVRSINRDNYDEVLSRSEDELSALMDTNFMTAVYECEEAGLTGDEKENCIFNKLISDCNKFKEERTFDDCSVERDDYGYSFGIMADGVWEYYSYPKIFESIEYQKIKYIFEKAKEGGKITSWTDNFVEGVHFLEIGVTEDLKKDNPDLEVVYSEYALDELGRETTDTINGKFDEALDRLQEVINSGEIVYFGEEPEIVYDVEGVLYYIRDNLEGYAFKEIDLENKRIEKREAEKAVKAGGGQVAGGESVGGRFKVPISRNVLVFTGFNEEDIAKNNEILINGQRFLKASDYLREAGYKIFPFHARVDECPIITFMMAARRQQGGIALFGTHGGAEGHGGGEYFLGGIFTSREKRKGCADSLRRLGFETRIEEEDEWGLPANDVTIHAPGYKEPKYFRLGVNWNNFNQFGFKNIWVISSCYGDNLFQSPSIPPITPDSIGDAVIYLNGEGDFYLFNEFTRNFFDSMTGVADTYNLDSWSSFLYSKRKSQVVAGVNSPFNRNKFKKILHFLPDGRMEYVKMDIPPIGSIQGVTITTTATNAVINYNGNGKPIILYPYIESTEWIGDRWLQIHFASDMLMEDFTHQMQKGVCLDEEGGECEPCKQAGTCPIRVFYYDKNKFEKSFVPYFIDSPESDYGEGLCEWTHDTPLDPSPHWIDSNTVEFQICGRVMPGVQLTDIWWGIEVEGKKFTSSDNEDFSLHGRGCVDPERYTRGGASATGGRGWAPYKEPERKTAPRELKQCSDFPTRTPFSEDDFFYVYERDVGYGETYDYKG